jgi:hypothetical protein
MRRRTTSCRSCWPAALALVLAMGGLTAGANASPITYEFGGTITSAAPATGVAPGTRFSGSFTYDPAATPTGAISFEGSLQTLYGQVESSPGSVPDASGIRLQVGTTPVYDGRGGLQVAVSEIDGKYGYHDADGNPVPPHMVVDISNGNVDDHTLLVALTLNNPGRAPLDSLNPPTSLSLADFPLATITIDDRVDPGSVALFTGTVDTLNAVPEPSTALFFLAAAPLGWLLRARLGGTVRGA